MTHGRNGRPATATSGAHNRVVVTGIGAITPIGSGREGLWAGVRGGRLAGRSITRFDPSPFASHVAAEIDDFDPLDYMEPKRAKRLDRFSQFSLAASRQALADAGLDPDGLRDGLGESLGVYLGTALGGIAYGEEQHERYVARGVRGVDPAVALAVFGGAGAANVAMEFGLRGPVVGNANSCASGLIAIGDAFRLIRSGELRAALAGAAEAPLAPLTFGAFALIKALTTRNDDPQHASRPFDVARDGFMMGEGAAVLFLEDLEHALERGARPYAEVLGYGTTNDAYHMTAPLPTGKEAARAMSLALANARVGPADVGYVNAHATGTPIGDPAETLAIRTALGEHAERVPVSCTKGLHGHALGATGAMEAAITALALDRRWLPGTANLDEPDPECDLCHVRAPGREARVDVAVTNSLGFGGINASLVLRRWEA